MRFDISHFLVSHQGSIPWQTLLEDVRARVQWYERLGFDGVWFGEHHFDKYGSDVVPNPVMLASDLAARTDTIRLGMAAVTLPLWHPIRAAEDLAMLDHFSKGRVDVAFSRGILPGEILNMNPEADRANDERSRAIFAENLQIVRDAWTKDPFRWQSERFQVPFPGMKWPGDAYASYHDDDGVLQGVEVIPHPYQKPMPPLYAVSQHVKGFQEAAVQGLGVITSHPTGKRIAELNAAYQEVAEKVGYSPHVGRSCVVARDFCIAETDAEARALSEEYLNHRFNAIARIRGIGEWLDPGEDPDNPVLATQTGFDIMNERDLILVGSPSTVADRMVRMAEELGVEHWLLAMGQIDRSAADRSFGLMANEVIPEVRRRVGEQLVAAGVAK